ncbi:MAG: hypothetical protein A3J24_01885 [Deltaproteobacteria bacterium RIFCSPLOWO2_02_FULL_53_8]|nr:MAG: hypothetical protein A3J24_01885 [Deltaproteobacteria bacterium RIFCSPLOWO2_02_FULL_53_8]
MDRAALAKEWMHKAKRDIGMVELALENRPDYTDAICFHCQQAVEKYLKAYLVWLDVEFERKHNLGYLLDLINEKDPVPDELYETLERLEDYAVAVRYPDDWAEITLDEAKEAYKTTLRVEIIVLEKVKI